MVSDIEDEIKILVNENGTMVAQAISGPIVVEEELPKDFGHWEEEEIRAHLRRFVAPKLKTKMTRLKEMAVHKVTPAQAERVTQELLELDARQPGETDVIRINRAIQKRVRRRIKGGWNGPEIA